MDRETAIRLAQKSREKAQTIIAQRQAAVEASKARKQLANKGVKEDQYKYYREMDIGAEQKRLDDLRKQQEVFKGFESLVGMGGTLDTPIYDGDTPIYFKDYFADYDQSIDLSTMEGRKQAITPYDRTSDINKLSKELDIARLAQSVNLDAKEDFKTYSVANDKATKALQKERRDSYLTPEEKRRYYYLYNTQGEGAAESYMRALQADLYSRGMQKVYDFADDNGWAGALASVGSVATSLLSGFEGAANLAAYAADKYIGLNEDAELRRGYLSDLTQAMRGGASADMGAGGSFVYDTVMSGVDSFLASFVPAGAVTLGLSAASQASNDILSRGGTGEQALVGGVAAGLFEGFFENFSISKLKSMDPDEITTSWKSFGKNIGKQVATNAQEEAATEAANIIFDTVAMGDISNAVLSYDRYVAEGMSEEDAKAKVIRDMALQIGEATASGALIGGAFGVGGAGVGAVARAKQGRSIVNDKGTKLNDLIEAGEATFVGDQYKGERELLEAVKANKSKNDVAQRNRVQKLDELLTKEAAERAKNAPTWAEQQKAMREATLKDVAGAVNKARGEAENAKIGKDITYTYMPSIANFSGAEGNSIFIEKSDGTTAKLSDLAVEDEELYEAYSLATSTGSVNNANAFIQNYRLHGNNVPVEEFWAAWIGVQNYGQTVTSDGAMEKAIAKYGTGNIPESALQAAFLSGRNMRTSTTEKYKATQEKYEKAWKDAGGKLTEARFNDNALKGKSLDKSQQEYRSFLRAFSRATGTNIEVFMSERGARKENGSYNRDTNTLRIDINAGIRNNANYTAMESSIVNTLSHEVVHNMRVTAPELYDALSAFVTETLQADENYDLDEAIEAEIEKGKQKDRELSREDAIEEIVARACEDRLGSSEKLRDFMIEFYTKDEKAANGFIKAVKEFIARLKSFFENIAKQRSSSEEAQLIAKQSAETIAEIQKRFDEALLAMREGNTARNAVEQVNVSIDAATESASPIMLSETTWRESEYVTKTEQAAAALAKALDVSTEDALKYIKNVNSVAKMIANDRARLDYFASSFGSAFVSNVEYGGSFDFTTLCKKRRIYTGTFSEIQKRLGEVALTPDQILEIRNLLIAARYEAPCGLCYVEGSRANMGKFAKKFIELYKRDNPGAWIPKMVDVNTPDGVEQMHRMHPECYEQYEYFWNHYGKLKDSDPALFASQQKPKLYEARKAYKNEILELFKTDTNVTNKNRNGGIRMQSFSDFEIVHAIDTMQIIMDMSRVGLAGQAYTKVPEFAKAFGDTGLKINLSLIAKGVDENGKIIFDDREGMPHETAFNIRKKHSENVGTILVIFNDAQLYAAMADDRIDFIIPFHRSQWKKGQYAAMGLPAGTKDYTYMQNEKLIKPTYHEYQGRMVKDKASNYMPNAYWDSSMSGKENAEAYLKMCAENNKRPKFYKLLDYDGNGTYSLKKDGSTDGYWKLLVDFKMYDNEGNGSPQTPVRPDFSMAEIRKMLKEYEGGHASYPVAHDVVDKFVDMYKAQETAKSSTLLTQPVKVGASLNNTMLQEREEEVTKITAGMTDDQRYELLKDRVLFDIKSVVDLSSETKRKIPKLSSWDDINNYLGSEKRNIIRALAKEFGAINKEYFNDDIRLSFEFSNNNFNETYKKQNHNFEAFAKMFSVFDNVVANAVGVEIHNNRDHKYDATLDNVYVLMGAYQDGDELVPVKLEVKKFKDKQNTLYVAVALEKIKMTEVLGRGNTENGVTQQPRSVNISISHIFSKIKPSDKSFLKYIPNGFLNSGQINAKQKAIAEAQNEDYMNAVNRGDIAAAQRLVDEAARKAGYTIKAYHGTPSAEFTVFDKNRVGKGNDQYGAGFYFTTDKAGASHYGNRVIDATLNINNPIRFTSTAESGRNLIDADIMLTSDQAYEVVKRLPNIYDAEESPLGDYFDTYWKVGAKDWMIRELAEQYRDVGYLDSDLFRNYPNELHEALRDVVGYDGVEVTFERTGEKFYVAWFDNQMKSTEPITYDDNGNVIPLSERFNERNPDIRYQDRDEQARYSLKDAVIPTREELEAKPPIAVVDLSKPKTHGTFAERRRKILDSIDDIISRPYLNEDTKTWIFITKKSYTHSFNNLGDMQLNATENIPDLIKNAVLTHVEDSDHGDTHADLVYTFFAAAKYDNNVLPVKLKVKEYTYSGQSIPQNIKNYFKNHPQDYSATYDTIVLEVEEMKKSPIGSVKNVNEFTRLNPTELSDISIAELLSLVKGESKKYIPDYKKTAELYQDRIETPEPSEVLRKYFAGNETYEGYKPYVESLKKYRDLMERVEVLEAKIDALNENIARLRSEHRQSGKGTRMDDLYKQKQNTEKRVEELRNRMFAMEAKELRRVVEAESKRVISDVRRAEKESFAEKSRERRENASKRQYIESIAKRTKAISELFAKNNAEKHIPDELKAPIAELMTALDFSSKRSLSGGDMTQKEEKLKAAVKRITELSALTNGQGLPALDLPPRFQKEWDAVKEAISVHTWGKGTMYPSQMILENMNSSDLRALNRSLMDIQHAINVANDVISQANAAPISALSGDLVRYLDNEVRQRKAQSDNLWQDTKNLLVWENTLPVYAFDRLGGTGRILFESFQNGFDQLVGEVNQIIDYTEKAYNTDEVKEWRKQVHSFECETLSGDSREIHLTVPQIMSFYCLSKREHAMPHFKGGGIVSEDIKAGKEKYKNDANGVRLTDETIVKILSTLTARQREVADKLQSFLNTECSAWGNEVSMKRYGIRMFTEQNYFPIRTKGSTRDISETNAPQNTKMYALLNMSFSKPLTELANNQMVISDIFEVFADHSNSMARYHSLALPVLDYMKVYNYREKIKSGDETDTSYEQKNVRDSVKNAYGDAGLKYFEEFITGINGANWTQDSNKLSAALTKSAKTAMVGFNLRTVVQQPTSAVRALMYLGLDDMTLSLNPTQIKKGHELAVKYCAMAKWKSMGYFDIGTGRGMERMLVGDETWKDKTIEASMYMAGKADELTLAYMWNACERWVSKHDKTLKKDTEEYYKAVGNKLREVIYRSQVVDSPLTRSKFMNSPSEFNKMLAMFGAEPTVTYNMALDVAYKIASAKSRKQAWGEQRRQFAGFIGIYATQALLLAAVQSAMDAIRDDDDEPYGDKYMDEFWKNLLAELNPLNKLPILRDIVSALEGYTTSRIDTTLWSKLSYLFKDVEKLIKGKDVTLYKWVYDILSAASTATGVAASNLVRDIVALWNTIIGSFFPHLKIKK